MTGRVVHFELPFDDKQRAMTFYQDVFGWRLDEMPELDYVGVLTGPVGQDGSPTEPGFIGGGMTGRGAQNTGTVITIDGTTSTRRWPRSPSAAGRSCRGRPR